MPTNVIPLGLLPPESLVKSLTRTVPDAVPSLFHSSSPVVALLAVKNTVVPTAKNPLGFEPNVTGTVLISRNK